MTRVRLLVIGCPRSATRYISQVLGAAGLAVGHERLGRDGSVSCFMAVDDYYYWISGHQSHRRAHLEPDLVFHQVRHPLAAIGSLATMNKGGFWHWQEKHTGISGDMDRVVRAARFWLEWNRICEAQRPDFTYRIEDLPWVELCARLGLRHQPLPGISRGLGKSSKAEPLSWDELAKRTGPIGERVMERARDYGYEE